LAWCICGCVERERRREREESLWELLKSEEEGGTWNMRVGVWGIDNETILL
jgi:hypothetical protein